MKSTLSWAEVIDRAKDDDKLEGARFALIYSARQAARLPIIRRVYELQDVGQNRTWLDGRSRVLEEEIRAIFALAMSDCGANGTLADELPLLAAAYRLTGEDVFRARVLAQLEEMASWSPLQRPGWTCYLPGARLPADGRGGNWLATGTGVRTIANTLEIMPAGSVDASLQERLDDLLTKEIASIVDDWETKRPWFVRSNNAITNQWVLPTEGLIRACLVVGVGQHREAYELGVKNMLQALDAHGTAGEFEEGIGYATFTVTSMLHAARAMAVGGDPRLLEHPFLQTFPTWMVHHIQPGHWLINAFDCGMFTVPRKGASQDSFVKLLSLLAACTESPVARWALADQFDAPSNDIAGLVYRTLPAVGETGEPPLYAAFERATRVNWRDSWAGDATGVWVRGGHRLDQHDHQDRGHVNLIARGKPILIEAGTPVYHNSRIITHYTSPLGHNVLQLGTELPKPPYEPGDYAYASLPGWQKPGTVAPITVRRLDATGGDIRVDGTRGYDGLERWHRDVSWTARELIVQDSVVLEDGWHEVVLFRWHLGGPQPAQITGQGRRYLIRWPYAEISIEGSEPLVVSTEKLPDNSLVPVVWEDESSDHLHTCLAVQTREKVGELKLTMRVEPPV